jgi:hypothetical protein
VRATPGEYPDIERGGKLFRWDQKTKGYVEVPSFARGGIVRTPTIAKIGDDPAGKGEAVVPLGTQRGPQKELQHLLNSERYRMQDQAFARQISPRSIGHSVGMGIKPPAPPKTLGRGMGLRFSHF